MSSEVFENREMDLRSLLDELGTKINTRIPNQVGGELIVSNFPTSILTVKFHPTLQIVQGLQAVRPTGH